MMMFDRDGAELFAGCLGEAECITVEDALADLPRNRAGVRIGSAPALRLMLSLEGAIGAIGAIAARLPLRLARNERETARDVTVGSGPNEPFE